MGHTKNLRLLLLKQEEEKCITALWMGFYLTFSLP